ncbi:MAG: DUF1573 domain-containing protein [Crocinitomicaceae bacterium]|nr:DUF1573 domain-containing protein [Crocinitomicaceae bacterium]
MRLFFAIIIIALNSALGFCQEAEFSIDKSVHKFPTTKQGEMLSHEYMITNDGDEPLIISDYKVGCTCTKAILPENPILPGETFPLQVTFDTKEKYYFQDRTIVLVANTKKKLHKIRFKVKVVPNE